MALTPILTTFDRSAMPNNLLTVSDWKRFAHTWLGQYSAWRRAAQLYAEQKGGALIMLADDSLVVLTKRSNGKISRRTYRPGKWTWATTA